MTPVLRLGAGRAELRAAGAQQRLPGAFTPFEPRCSPSLEAAAASLPSHSLPPCAHPGQELLFSCPLFPPSFPVPTGTGRSGNGPEIVTAGPQCLLDIAPTSSSGAEQGLCLSFPPREGIPHSPIPRQLLSVSLQTPGSGWETWWECWRVALCTLSVVVATSGSSQDGSEVLACCTESSFPSERWYES